VRGVCRMTWKSHSLTTGALALALTGRMDVMIAAVATATLPDTMERLLPLGRHRGMTHWVLLWVFALALLPACAEPRWSQLIHLAHSAHLAPWLPSDWMHWTHGKQLWSSSFAFAPTATMVGFGLTLGPLLHVLLDGCSTDGVPVGPFIGGRMRLSLYRTWNRAKWPWDFSEMLFVLSLLTGSVIVWQMRWQ
jgi:hypothetical protein